MEQKVQGNATQLQKPGRKPSEELQQHYERLKENHGIPHFISDVDSRDVPRIVGMFDNEYVKYYGKYVDEEAFSEFIQAMGIEDVKPDGGHENETVVRL
ncbi:MAG: hypothetical protein H8Z69_00895 [Nanohaloarchaea archaeon]|nr:hypothetical protein [Candidatus Nanohaloarchaea archaeon]